MKQLILFIAITIFFATQLQPQTVEDFDNYFTDQTMRIDYFHIGDAIEEFITLDQVYQYGIWAGSRINLLDNFNNGRYYVNIYDAESRELIFSKGFDNYFGEYKTSEDAIDMIKRTYHETVLIPFPKNIIIFSIEKRDRNNHMFQIFTEHIDPADVSIIRDEIKDRTVAIYESDKNDDPHSRVDIAILGEGYTLDDRRKFEEDLKYFTNVFFSQPPYSFYEDKFNIYGVYKPSEESGVDEPRANIYKNTVMNCTFNSLGSERYLLTEDNKAVRDMAAHVPYDALYIMVNHSRYGGGGIYNLYCTFTTGNQYKDYLFIHEFGHSFTGLADEYYTSSTAYNDFYPQGVEPVEPNITALTDPQNVKWEKLLTPGIGIPTLWEKADYDSMELKWQKERREMNDKIAELKRNKAHFFEIEKAEQEYAQKDKEHSLLVDSYLRGSKYRGQVGVFEGAGYSSKGLYRPMLDCIMFSKGDKPFCTVCNNTIVKVINHYSE
ncbi:MAG: peptidase M64 [Ignavibacteriae bacterium]|nr:MAG: peptidase M64 [Ignavibacteriota bacterium]